MGLMILLIPLLVVISSVLIYQYNGRREFIRFDLVQFVYAFLFAPVMYVWLKNLLFYLLRQELDLHLSVAQIFAADTVFSIFFMFMYAFIVIHSLTKSFELKRERDPLYDLTKDSEFLHLWVSHLVFNFGMTLIISIISFTNVFIPLVTTMSKSIFYVMLGGGVILGIGLFVSLWLSNFSANFVRLMKLFYGFVFTLHVGMYFSFDPSFDATHSIFWITLMALSACVFCTLSFERYERPMNWIQKLHYKFIKS